MLELEFEIVPSLLYVHIFLLLGMIEISEWIARPRLLPVFYIFYFFYFFVNFVLVSIFNKIITRASKMYFLFSVRQLIPFFLFFINFIFYFLFLHSFLYYCITPFSKKEPLAGYRCRFGARYSS